MRCSYLQPAQCQGCRSKCSWRFAPSYVRPSWPRPRQVICCLLLASRTSLPAVFTPDAAVIREVSSVRRHCLVVLWWWDAQCSLWRVYTVHPPCHGLHWTLWHGPSLRPAAVQHALRSPSPVSAVHDCRSWSALPARRCCRSLRCSCRWTLPPLSWTACCWARRRRAGWARR